MQMHPLENANVQLGFDLYVASLYGAATGIGPNLGLFIWKGEQCSGPKNSVGALNA